MNKTANLQKNFHVEEVIQIIFYTIYVHYKF